MLDQGKRIFLVVAFDKASNKSDSDFLSKDDSIDPQDNDELGEIDNEELN